MDITIAITNHNQEESLSKAIFSIYNQTEIPTMIYVLSDGKMPVNFYKNVYIRREQEQIEEQIANAD